MDIQVSNGVDPDYNHPTRTYEEQIQCVGVFAQPMASEKLTKRLYKLARKAKRIKRTDVGIKAILKAIEKKGASGIVLLAGDISPFDLISHVPLVCEEHDIPYCYVPSKFDLGASVSSVTPIPIVFISRDEQYGDLYDKCYTTVDALPLPL
uniref:H/ACA ribonucleoprotein complex subunit 2 n=1 Tax=Schistosoma japonicum TaxID=6182 RepID=C1L7Y8_SCHJA|nr:H/ACA ribonucleoprotein complex subunit 2 [Schistosoma japonicum]